MIIINTFIFNDSDSRESFGMLTKKQYDELETEILKSVSEKWRNGESFRVCDIVGKNWSGTPYQALHDVIAKSNKFKAIETQAGIDMGYLFKKIIAQSKYPFKFEKVPLGCYQVTKYVPLNPEPIIKGNE